MEGSAAAPATTTNDTKTPGKIVSAGAPVKADFNAAQLAKAGAEAGKEGGEADSSNQQQQQSQQTQQQQSGSDNTDPNKDKTKPADAKSVTQEDVIEYLKGQNIPVENFDKLKEKLTSEPAKAKTPEEIKAEELALEQKMIALHLKNGGTVEQYTQFKNISTADPKVLGVTKIQEELIKDGFSKEQADTIVKRMHLQYSEEDIAEMKPEEVELLKKEAAYGLKKQENRGKVIQNMAKVYLDNLKKQVEDQDAELSKVGQHSSKVEDAIKKVLRKQQIQLGEYDGQPLDPVDVEISDEILSQVKAILNDPAELEKKLYNADGTFNLEFLVNHLVSSFSREMAVKHGLLAGQTRQVDFFKKKFGETIPDLGGEKKTTGTPGKIVGKGEPVLMQRQPQN